MKGIILSGGMGTRLYPLTTSVSKQLLPIYDKPMIYYPLSTLMQLGIKKILVITNSFYLKNYEDLLQDGSQWGIDIKYETQDNPNGIAEAFIIGKDFIGKDPVTLILGDNIFYGLDFNLVDFKINDKAYIYLFKVADPSRYGVANLKNNEIINIIEKPKNPKSDFVVTGLYMYPNNIIDYVKKIKPSKRNELEITDLNNIYIKRKNMNAIKMKKVSVWLDAGTTHSIVQASQFVQTIQERQNVLFGSPDEIAYSYNLISKQKFKKLVKNSPTNEYFNFLKKIN